MNRRDYDPAFDAPEEPDAICTTKQIANHIGASDDEVGSLRHRVYKDTTCGASLGIMDGSKWLWSDSDRYTGKVYGISIGGYVEGTDAECPTYEYKPGKESWKKWLDRMLIQVDEDADLLWKETHGCCVCAAQHAGRRIQSTKYAERYGFEQGGPVHPECPVCKGEGIII